jgi:membrane protease YdiL (CAAX protease family)
VIAFGALASLAWCAAFAAGRATGHIYAFMGPTAALLCGLVLWRAPAVRARFALSRATAVAVGVDVVVGVVVGVASVVATELAFPVAAGLFPSLEPGVRELYAISGVTSATAVAVVVVAVCEEVLWRGLWVEGLRARGAVVAVVVAAVAYTLAQAGAGSLWLLLAALSFGVVWGALAWVRPTLWASTVAHLIWTLTVLGLRPLVALS